jgi:hypothetical protein
MARVTVNTVLKAGLIVGLLDILAAFVHYYLRTEKNPLVVLKFIASGAFGRAALAGGSEMILWGLLFHFLIALSFTGFFFWVVTRLAGLTRAWVLTGIVYGLLVWAVMNLVVVPLSRTPKVPFSWSGTLIGMTILVCCMGLPLAYIVRYFSRQEIKSIKDGATT